MKKIILTAVLIALAAVSFFAGGCMKEQKYMRKRAEHCKALIVFAEEKAKNRDISDPGVMKAMISNIYAAYNYCDDSVLANELHDLWNDLVFGNEDYEAVKNDTQKRLDDILQRLRKK